MTRRPNVLFIFSDQHRPQAMGCAGDPNVETPNLDRLAAEGLRFDRAYANTPICSPFRASLYTGQYSHAHGVISLHRPLLVRPQLAEVLSEHGYLTSHVGKWHLAGGAAPQRFVSPFFRPGWCRWQGWENSNRFFTTDWHRGEWPHDVGQFDTFQTDALTDLTLEFLREQACQPEQPWFHVLSAEPPHDPHVAPEEDMAAYRERPIIWRDNVPTDPDWRAQVDARARGYYAQITNLDRNVGRILDELARNGQDRTTLVFYLSDHGELLGSHGMVSKSRPEEESSRIPLIMRGPGVAGGRVTESLISAVDLMPTLLGLLDLPIPAQVQGLDLSAMVSGTGPPARTAVLLQFEQHFWPAQPEWRYRALITPRWVYTHFAQTGPTQLFDLHKDPLQMRNLVHESRHLPQRQQMHALLERELTAVGDPYFTVATSGQQ